MPARVKRLSAQALAKLLPYPAADANKYTRGKLTAIGGNAAYPGSICMASSAALRMGAGYVEVVCAPQTLPIVHGFNPTLVARAWDGFKVGETSLASAKEGHPQACLIGSGFTTKDPAELAMLLDVLANCVHPAVVDGGAIEAIASPDGIKAAQARAEAGHATIITPHFGEAARLGAPFNLAPPAKPAASHEEDAEFATKLAAEYGSYIVLKGACTFIASPPGASTEDVVYLMDSGGPELAKAGTGDVLAGIISSIACQTQAGAHECLLGATLHAMAGENAADSMGTIGVEATDLIAYLADAIRNLKNMSKVSANPNM